MSWDNKKVIWPLQDKFLTQMFLGLVTLPFSPLLVDIGCSLSTSSGRQKYIAQAIEHVANGCLPGTELHDPPPLPPEKQVGPCCNFVAT